MVPAEPGLIPFLNLLNIRGILGLSETWLNNYHTDEAISISGYKIVRNDRDSRGGGVAFYIKENIKFRLLETHIAVNSTLECLWISLKIGGKNVCIGTLYKPPKTNLKTCLDDLENFLNTALPLPLYDLVLFGEEFIDMLTDSAGQKMFTNLMNNYGQHIILVQIIHF